MTIDFHVHLFPGPMRINRESFFSGEPAFKLLYGSPQSKMAGISDTLKMMDEQGISRSVVFGFPWQNAETFKRHNDYILDAVARHPDRFVGLGCMDPFSPGAAEEVRRCLAGGLAGIGELAFYTSGIDETALERLEPLMADCRRKNALVLIHTNEPVGHVYPGKSPNTLKQIDTLVRRFPENRLILAHWGGGVFFFNLLKKDFADHYKNVWFDSAASPFLYRPDIYRYAIALAGPDKILFGTDFPLLKPERYLRDMKSAGLTAAEMDLICGKNAETLLDILTGSDAVKP